MRGKEFLFNLSNYFMTHLREAFDRTGKPLAACCLSLLMFGTACSPNEPETAEIENIKVSLRSNLDLTTAGPVIEKPDILPANAGEAEAPLGTRRLTGGKYQDISRYELLPKVLRDEKRKKLKIPLADDSASVLVGEKQLVLGGRGFDIQGFASHSELPLEMNFGRRPLKEEPPAFSGEQEKLEPLKEDIRTGKVLIFHSRPTGYFSSAAALENEADVEPARTSALRAETLPLLEPGKVSIDLLRGNETLNKDEYDRIR